MTRNMSGGRIAPAEYGNVFCIIIDPTFLWHQRKFKIAPKGFFGNKCILSGPDELKLTLNLLRSAFFENDIFSYL